MVEVEDSNDVIEQVEPIDATSLLIDEGALFLKDTTAAIEPVMSNNQTSFVSDIAKIGAPIAVVALAVYGIIKWSKT